MGKRSESFELVLVGAIFALAFFFKSIFDVFFEEWIKHQLQERLGLTVAEMIERFGAITIPALAAVAVIWFVYRYIKRDFSNRTTSPLSIIFDPTNSNRKFWSIEPLKDKDGKHVGTYWEYRAIIRNTSSKTVRNVRATVEAVGAMPTRPAPSLFDINKKPVIDLAPQEEALAVIRTWYNPPIVAGLAIGPDIYGPVKMTASGDDVLPTTKWFGFEPMNTPMIVEVDRP